MDPGIVRDLLTVGAGVGTGVLSGLFGVGGAVISTPAVRALGLSAALAVGTTLPSIIPGAATGAFRYAKEGLIDPRVVRATAPTGALAAIVGSLLAPRIPGDGHVLMLATAALLAFSAVRMYASGRAANAADDRDLREPESDAETADLTPQPGTTGPEFTGEHDDPRPVAFAVIGAMAGLLSGLLGVGGGILMVPAFTQVIHVPLKRAIATSLACVAIFAVPGTITHAVQGTIDWRFALLLCVGVVPGARIGSALTVRADLRTLRIVVAMFLGTMSVLFAVGELLALT